MDSAFLKDPVFAWFGIILALAFGTAATVATVMVARRDPKFMGGRYIKALAGMTVIAICVPALTFLMGGMTPTPPQTLAEAYLLGGGIVGGWDHVLFGYALWVGLAVGGLLALLIGKYPKELKPEPPELAGPRLEHNECPQCHQPPLKSRHFDPSSILSRAASIVALMFGIGLGFTDNLLLGVMFLAGAGVLLIFWYIERSEHRCPRCGQPSDKGASTN